MLHLLYLNQLLPKVLHILIWFRCHRYMTGPAIHQRDSFIEVTRGVIRVHAFKDIQIKCLDCILLWEALGLCS